MENGTGDYIAIEQARKSGSFPTYEVIGNKTNRNLGHTEQSLGLYTRTAYATCLIAKNHPVDGIQRPYQIDVGYVVFVGLTD